jgi:hypothetical protein
MSNYFEEFPVVDYKFGDEETFTTFQHLGTYVDIIDQVKSYNVYYQDYSIQNGERPDQLSSRLYRNPNYYWTFYLLNDHLRQGGWPIRDADVYPKAQEYYPNTVLGVNGVSMTQEPKVVNREILWMPTSEQIPLTKSTNFVVGNYLYFPNSKLAGKILKIDQKMGFITTDADGVRAVDNVCSAISAEEGLKVIADANYVPVEQYAIMEIDKVWDEFDAPHHYEDVSGNWIYPQISSTAPYPFNHNRLVGWDNDYASSTYRTMKVVSTDPTTNSVSNYQRLANINEEQKSISVIKKESIAKIAKEFRRLLRNEG